MPAPNGRQHARLGRDCFMREDYPGAVRHYKAAIKAGGSPRDLQDWGEMLAIAEANATSKIKVEIPKPVYFDAKTLLAPPLVRDGDLPRPPRHRRWHRCFKRLRLFLGDRLGAVGTVVMDWLI